MSSSVNDDLNDIIIKQLECPVCFEICNPPIYMCNNGHNVCSLCVEKIRECSICREAKPTGRNRLAEDLSTTVLRPCKHEEQGCRNRFCLKDLEEHLLGCQYGYQCHIHGAAQQCPWNGPRDRLQEHAVKCHKGRYRACPADERPISWQFNLGRTYETVALFDLQGDLFWCTMSYDYVKKTFSGFVRYIGRDSEAKRFRCRFRFVSGGRELCYSCDVMTLHHDATRKETEMLCGEIVDAFADNNYMTCEVFIMVKDEKKAEN